MDRHGSVEETDSAVLAMLGKKQVLKRRFSFISMFAFAVCELITWETVLAIFYEAFDNGGPAGAIYGFIIAWSSTLSVYTVISELASLAPIAGGQYYVCIPLGSRVARTTWLPHGVMDRVNSIIYTRLCLKHMLTFCVSLLVGVHACSVEIQNCLQLCRWLAYFSGVDCYRGY
jgi:hypothetical protein